jgi:hypothetical protein
MTEARALFVIQIVRLQDMALQYWECKAVKWIDLIGSMTPVRMSFRAISVMKRTAVVLLDSHASLSPLLFFIG